MTDDPSRMPTEIAHVLFMDLVGYSRLSIEKQALLVGELRDLVRSTPEFQRAERRSELIIRDTGDGMALVFSRDPSAPVRCAVEVAHALTARPHLRLRMGIHSGPISRVKDIDGKENVSGSGINTAQRVMDCGDAGHILLSHRTAEDLLQFEQWATYIKDLGECEVKNGKVYLFNFYTEEVGNPASPQKLRSTEPARGNRPGSGTGPLPSPEKAPASGGQRVALLYKRNVEPDEQLMKLLEAQLTARGHQVFVDRHMHIGIEWLAEIERKIYTSDAVIPLLSEQSVKSDMIEFELETAHTAAQQQGKPRILPVRVNFTGPLPNAATADILKPLMYNLWVGEKDNERLIDELDYALRNPPRPVRRPEKLEPAGGAVPLDSEFYIVRSTDEQFKTAIARQDSIVLVKGARQMGKTSLLARGLQQAREAGARVVLTDFQTLNAAHLASAETLYMALAEMIAEQLDLDVNLEEIFSNRRGANMNLERFLRREVLGSISEPVVWGLDEVDRLFLCSFGSEVFGLFRSWYNRRSLDPSGPWSRLTLAIAYATEAHLFITDLNQSPFNVGTRLTLSDFTLDQVAELNRRYGEPLRNEEELQRFYRLLSGHPYLVRRGLEEMVTQEMDIEAFEAQADRDDGLFGDHLRRILVSLSQDPELKEVVRGVLQGKPCPTPESFYRLRGAGVMAGESARDVYPRCQLYTTYLARHLL